MAVKHISYRPHPWDRYYLPALLKGLAITFKHIFQKKYTVQYPEEKWPVPKGHRGAIRLNNAGRLGANCAPIER